MWWPTLGSTGDDEPRKSREKTGALTVTPPRFSRLGAYVLRVASLTLLFLAGGAFLAGLYALSIAEDGRAVFAWLLGFLSLSTAVNALRARAS